MIPEPSLKRYGLDYYLVYPNQLTFILKNARDSRDGGVHGEVAIFNGQRLTHCEWKFSSVSARTALAKELTAAAPEFNWREILEDASYRFIEAHRAGEPGFDLDGTITPPSDGLLPDWLYAAEPTLLAADGDTGKSWTALALAVSVQTGQSLIPGLAPTRAGQVAWLDWENPGPTTNTRLGLLCRGFGIAAPPIRFYQMRGPLVGAVRTLAAECAKRHVVLVVLDSQIRALPPSDHWHEAQAEFWNALKLFDPAATLTITHTTNEDARERRPSRPFGGQFAFAGPRLIWTALRDETTPGLISFACVKANNLPRKPLPFALQLTDEGDRTTILPAPLPIPEPPPDRLRDRLQRALNQIGPSTIAQLAEEVGEPVETVRRHLNRHRLPDGPFRPGAVLPGAPQVWSV